MRLQFGLMSLATAVTEAIRAIGTEETTARLNPSKPYKPRRLKLDPIHRMARVLYKMKTRNPKFVREQKLRQKLYRRKNKQLLKRRADFVDKARDRMGLD